MAKTKIKKVLSLSLDGHSDTVLHPVPIPKVCLSACASVFDYIYVYINLSTVMFVYLEDVIVSVYMNLLIVTRSDYMGIDIFALV